MRAQLGVYEEQRAMLDAQQAELERARKAVAALAAAKPGDVVLVPIGGGAFARVAVVEGGRVLTPVGAGVHVEADAAEADRRLGERAESARRARERIDGEARGLSAQYEQLVRGLQALEG